MINNIKKVFKVFDKDQKKKFVTLSILVVTSAILDLVSLGAFIPLLIALVEDDYQKISFFNFIFEKFSFINENNLVLYLVSALFFMFLFKSIFSILLSTHKYRILFSIMTYITTKLAETFLKIPYVRFLKLKPHKIIELLTREVEYFVMGVIDPLTIMILELIILIFIFLFLIYYDYKSSIFILLVSFFILGFFLIFFSKKTKELGLKKLKSSISFHKNLTQAIHGIRDIKLLKKEEIFLKHFYEDSFNLSKYFGKLKVIAEIPRFQLELFATILLNIVIFVNFFLIENKDKTLVILGLFGIAAFRILPSLNRVIQSINSIRASYGVIDLINENASLSKYINQLVSKKDKEQANKEDISSLELKNIKFQYEANQAHVLNNVNLKLKKGNLVGIYGPSGSGKTTLVDIITNLLDPTDGQVLINNSKIDNKNLFRNSIGYVPQFIYILNDTLKNNIAFRENETDIQNSKLEFAIKKSLLKELIERLPKGLDTEVGEMGSNLSGGQIQRIGISRVLYENPSLIIFDESTNSLDKKSEDEILKIIHQIKKDKIIIFITHKLDILNNNFDEVYEMKNGLLIKN